jgi:hypothetical protein
MRNSDPADDYGLWYRSDRSDDVLTELPSFWGAVGETEYDLAEDGGPFPLDPPQPRASGRIAAALSWLLQFLLEGFAACGYAMCPHVIDPNETFETWNERRRSEYALTRDEGPSGQTSDKWRERGF